MEMQETWSSEMLVDFQLTTWRYVQGDTALFPLSHLFPYLAAQVFSDERMIAICVLWRMMKEDSMIPLWYSYGTS